MKINSIWKIYCVFMALSVVIRCRNHFHADCHGCLLFMLSSTNVVSTSKSSRDPENLSLNYNSIEQRREKEIHCISKVERAETIVKVHASRVGFKPNKKRNSDAIHKTRYTQHHIHKYFNKCCVFFRASLNSAYRVYLFPPFSLSIFDLCEVIWYAGHTHITFSANLSQ